MHMLIGLCQLATVGGSRKENLLLKMSYYMCRENLNRRTSSLSHVIVCNKTSHNHTSIKSDIATGLLEGCMGIVHGPLDELATRILERGRLISLYLVTVLRGT